ncbi:hypothetical protein DPMN_028829 [Dreissena polymorpha]|uniref:Uncharacterized protein n=1 Tax=Dreissena polymorpha TaxID=45954 RepID=A0A9D4REP9_DREPO|nr:hypothetical protein DPMN_028829 [Dreissena polymorpha]
MIAGSLFSELSVVEIKKASAAPRECVSTVVCYLTVVKGHVTLTDASARMLRCYEYG